MTQETVEFGDTEETSTEEVDEAQALGERLRLEEEAREEGRKLLSEARRMGVPEQQMGQLVELLEEGDLVGGIEKVRKLGNMFKSPEKKATEPEGEITAYMRRTGTKIDDLTGGQQIQLGLERQAKATKMGAQDTKPEPVKEVEPEKLFTPMEGVKPEMTAQELLSLGVKQTEAKRKAKEGN